MHSFLRTCKQSAGGFPPALKQCCCTPDFVDGHRRFRLYRVFSLKLCWDLGSIETVLVNVDTLTLLIKYFGGQGAAPLWP